MKLKTLALIFSASLSGTMYAQEIHLQPHPQQVTQHGKIIGLTGAYKLSGEKEAGKEAVQLLKTLLPDQQKNKGFQIIIGEKGDKSVARYARLIPEYAEGYYLLSDGDKLVIAGNDERGTYYGIQTLSQLIKDNHLPAVEIRDYPDIRFRGVVEGFYGTPWSYDDRIGQLRYYGKNKLNTYIYGPKDDPYHSSPNWRLPYPEKEAAQLSNLIKEAHANKVDFVWAIHPGQDIKWNDQDRDLVLDKFEKMYQLGVRSFAVFFDDISGEGTNPEKQAALLNYIDENFVKVKSDVTPLIMCPTEYNKSWSNPAKGYLTTLGDKLNPSIHIMWTGDRVISDITKEGLDWINARIKRPAYIWWNFPVSDYVRDHLLMGPSYGIDTTVKNEMSGFVTNPMERAEASKIAIYSVADYAWNLEAYNSDKAWENALKDIMPTTTDAFRIFAAHNSDLGKNGHGYRRDESVGIKPVTARFWNDYKQGNYKEEDFNTLNHEFENIRKASDILLTSKDNLALIKEITPWINQFRVLGETGIDVLMMVHAYQAKDTAAFVNLYNQVKEKKARSFEIDQTFNQNPYQPGVKTATLVLQPLVDSVFVTVTKRFNAEYKQALSEVVSYCPHTLVSDVPQLKNLPLQVKTDKILVSPMLEVVKWNPGASLSIVLDNVYKGQNIDFSFGVKDLASWGILEVSANGKDWTAVDFIQKESDARAALNNIPVKAVRFTNKSGIEQQVYLRRFVLSVGK